MPKETHDRGLAPCHVGLANALARHYRTPVRCVQSAAPLQPDFHPILPRSRMKTALSALVLAMCSLVSLPAASQTTCQTIGFQRVCSGADGSSSTSQRIGNQYITNYSNGQFATTQQI